MTKTQGQTTRQMLAAPKGAVFIWPVPATRQYAVHLARHLGRADLIIGTPGDLVADKWRHRNIPALILDHGCNETGRLGDREWQVVHWTRRQIELRARRPR